MQEINGHNVSDLLRLTPQQQRVLEALKDRETEEYPLSRWYLGALCALNNEQNPDRIAQSAQSLRELLEKLPRVVLGLGAQRGTSDFAGMRRSIIQRISKAKSRYSKGWLNEKIDSSLAKTFEKMVRYFELNQQPTRKQRIQTAVAALDPLGNRFGRQTQEKKRVEFNGLWQRLENFAHHKAHSDIEEFNTCLNDTERAVFDLLAPITAENQKEIQTILRNVNRSETDVEKMFSLIERRGANYVFFFKHAAETGDTSWLSHLDKRGYFTDPRAAEPIGNDRVNYPFWWPMRYLTKMAPHAPDDVIEIVLRLPKTDNPWIYNEILEIALQLLGSHSAKLQPKILEYANLEHHFLAYRFADVLAHWTKKKQTSAALKLAKALVKFVPDPEDKTKRKRRGENPKDSAAIATLVVETQLDPSPRIDDTEYPTILSDGVRSLAEKEPYKVARILIDATVNLIRLKTHESDLAEHRDYSDAWCERLIESENGYDDPKTALVHTLTYACEQVYEQASENVSNLDEFLRSQEWRVFNRLRHHLFALHPIDTTKPWIQELILNYANYDRWQYGYEFQKMIQNACQHFGTSLLTETERRQIFDAICRGPSKADYRAWVVGFLGDVFTEEKFEVHQRRFHRMQMNPFKPLLFGEYATYYQGLEQESKDSISDEDYPPHKTRGGYVFKRSPRSPEDLASLTDGQLLAYINEWNKKEEDLEGDDLIEIDTSGLSRAFQSVFKESIFPVTDRRQFWIANLESIKEPIYLQRMIEVMQEQVETRNFDKLEEWLAFAARVLSYINFGHEVSKVKADELQEVPDSYYTRWAVGEFIRVCLGKDVEVPISAREQLAKILEMLCTQFDWHLDQEKANYSNEMDLPDKAINNARGNALRELVNFGLWLRRHDLEVEIPKVTTILEKRLALDAAHPLTLPEYAMLGLNYNQIFYLNEAWATIHKSDLFPQTEFPKWLAAFHGFITHNRMFEPTFEVLRGDFEFALQNLAQFKKQHRRADQLIYLLGKRLFTLYLWEKYPLTGDESLLEEYYTATFDNPEHWANMFEHVGRMLRDTTEELDTNVRDRIVDFFDWRIAIGEPKELKKFTFWLKARCLDARWRLKAYSKILDICKAEDMAVAIQIDALCEMLPDYTAEVVACFTKLTDGFRSDTIDIYTKGATSILKAGIESSDKNVRRNAARAYENLLRTGRLDLEALADELSDKFMEFVGPDRPPLSDHAVSREGIYEDDV